MSRMVWKRQLAEMKRRAGVEHVVHSPIFISVVDCSVPDPGEAAAEALDFGDQALVGYRSTSGGKCFLRQAGEKLAAFQKRVHRAAPDNLVFWPMYRGDTQVL